MKIAPPTRNRNKNSQLRWENGDGSLIDKIIVFSSTPPELIAAQVNKPAKFLLMLVMVKLEDIVKVMFPGSLLASCVILYFDPSALPGRICPSCSHLTAGRGVPDTWHVSVALLPSTTRMCVFCADTTGLQAKSANPLLAQLCPSSLSGRLHSVGALPSFWRTTRDLKLLRWQSQFQRLFSNRTF